MYGEAKGPDIFERAFSVLQSLDTGGLAWSRSVQEVKTFTTLRFESQQPRSIFSPKNTT
jgi:hypothetical protein